MKGISNFIHVFNRILIYLIFVNSDVMCCLYVRKMHLKNDMSSIHHNNLSVLNLIKLIGNTHIEINRPPKVIDNLLS